MKSLSSFNEFALTKSEMKGVRGGETAWCTNGFNARCYQDFNEAAHICYHVDFSCNSIEKVEF